MENELYVKAETYVFHVTMIPFLGYIFEAGCIQTDTAKIEAVTKREPPDNRIKLQQFLGFANFYHFFIQNYSNIASPLIKLTCSLRPISLREAQTAFDTLRNLFITAPYSFSLILLVNLLWKSTPPFLVLQRFFPKERSLQANQNHVPVSPGNSHPLTEL